MKSEDIYLLFLEEALELLPLIQAGLRELSQNYSQPGINSELSHRTIADVLRLLNTLNRGATQARDLQVKEKEISDQIFNLDELQTLIGNIQNCLSSFLEQPPNANAIKLKKLWQTYQELKYSLLTHLSQAPSGKLAILAKGELLFSLTQLSSQLSLHTGVDRNLLEAIVSQDMVQSLINLELIWDSVDASEQSIELKHQAEIFSGLGELLELKELIAIANSVSVCVEDNKDNLFATQLITQRALACWQAVQASLSKGNNNDRAEDWRNYLFLTEDNLEDRPTAISTSVISEIKSEQILKTEQFFMWLFGYNIFFLPANLVLAMVIPQAKQIKFVGNRQVLRWEDQNIPLYKLSDLLNYNYPLPNDLSSAPSRLILVVQHNFHSSALDISVEQPLVESSLTLKPCDPILTTPNYVCGFTLWSNDRIKAVIDVQALLDQRFED